MAKYDPYFLLMYARKSLKYALRSVHQSDAKGMIRSHPNALTVTFIQICTNHINPDRNDN